jgi:hypothetical protein
MMKTRRRLAALFAALVALLVLGVAHAGPGQTVTAEVMVLHATQQPGAGSIDPSIGNMPQLKRPPFSAYNTYKLLAKQSLALSKGRPVTYTLANGRVLQVTLQDVTADHRFKVAAAINQPGGSAYLKLLEVTAAPNETFFVAGQQYQGGVLIIGFTLH